MDEEALQDAYNLFSGGGYNGSIDDFKVLIGENEEALKVAHSIFSKSGYNGDISEFYTLIGVKKKDFGDIAPSPKLVSNGVEIPPDVSSDTTELPQTKEEVPWYTDLKNRFLSGGATAAAGIAGLKNYITKLGNSIIMSKEDLAELNKLDPQVREIILASRGGLDAFSDLKLIEAQNWLTDKSEELSKKTIEIQGNIIDNALSTNPKDKAKAAYQVLQGVVEAIPALVEAFVPGGLVLIGAQTAAQKQETEEREGADIDLKTTLNAGFTGATEAFFERYTVRLLKPIKEIAKGNKVVAKEFSENFTKRVFKSMGIEGASEAATTASQELLGDALIQGKDVNPWQAIKNTVDAGIIGSAMGGGIASVAGMQGYIANRTLTKDQKNIRSKMIEGAKKLVDDSEKVDDPTVKKAMTNKAKALQKESKEIFNVQFKKVKSLKDEDAVELLKVEKSIDDLVKKQKIIQDNLQLEEKTKEVLLKDGSKKYQELAIKKTEILEREPRPKKAVVERETVQKIVKVHEENEGSSISQSGKNLFGKRGYSVGIFPELTEKVDGKKITKKGIEDFKKKNKDILEDQNNFVGTWFDGDTGKSVIDVAVFVKGKKAAIDLAVEHNQKKIYDLKTGKEIDTGGTGEAVNAANTLESIALKTNKDTFLTKTHKVPLEGLDPNFNEETKNKILATKSKNPNAPIVLGFENGKPKILDGVHRFYEAQQRGDKTINVRFTVNEGGEVFWSGVNKKEEKIDISESLQLDKADDFLKGLEEKLDESTKDTLGINIPVVVAKGVVQAMRVAVKTAKTTADIISAGINYLKSTDWYKGLNKKEQKEAENNIMSDLLKTEEKPEAEISAYPENRIIRIPVGRGKVISMTVPTSIDGMIDRTILKIADKYFPVRKTQKFIEKVKGRVTSKANFDRAETLLQGKASNDLDIFKKRMITLAKEMAKNNIDSKQLSDYLYAKHAPERNKHIKENIDPENEKGSGITNKKAGEILKGFTEKESKALETLSKEIYSILEDTRKLMQKYELESGENIDVLRSFYKNYVPLKGYASDEVNGTEYVDVGQSLSVKGKETRRAAGRSSEAANVVANVIVQHTNTIIRGRKNEVMQTLYNLVKDNKEIGRIFSEFNPDRTRAIIKGKLVKDQPIPMEFNDRYVGVKIKGKKFYIKFTNEELSKVISAANIEKSALVARTLGKFSRILSALLTSLNPEFVVSNFTRDIQTAMYNQLAESDISENTLKGKDFIGKTVKQVFPSMKAIYKSEMGKKAVDTEIEQYYKEFKEDGAKTGWFYARNSAEIQKDINNIIALQNSQTISLKGAKRGFKSLGDFISNVNSSVENAVRLSAYMNARKAGVDRLDAAQYAKELTVNFNKSGQWGTVLNSFYLFFNASMQGTMRFAKSMLTLKKTVTPDGTKYGLNRAQKLAGAVTAFSSVLAIMNMAISGEDDDGESFYSKVPDWEKERNMIIMNPLDPEGKDYFKIPLPYGYSIFNNMGTMVAEVTMGDRKIGDASNFMFNGILGSFSPISFSESGSLDKSAMKAIVPTVMKPFLELAINENHFGSTIYNENLPFGTPKPESTLGRRMTPAAFKQLSKFLNEVSGGSEFVSGGADINPDKIYHLFKFAGGGVGKFIGRTSSTTEALIKKAQGVPSKLEARNIPFLGRLYGEPSDYADLTKYFDRRIEINQLYAEYRAASTEDKKKDKYKGIVKLRSKLKSSDKRLKSFRKRRDRYSDIKDPILKATKLNELEEKTDDIVDKFNKEYNKYN